MDFIHNIDLVGSLAGSIVDLLPEVSNIVNATIAGSVNLYDV
jgi:hypothetical protein